MSQAKVDRYKEQKANRQKIMQREKREKFLWKLGASVVLLALAVWIGYSAFDRLYEAPIRYYDADVTAIGDYLSSLSETEEAAQTEGMAEDSEEAAQDGTEAVAEDATDAQETTEAQESATEA